jgi:hypothetical protein
MAKRPRKRRSLLEYSDLEAMEAAVTHPAAVAMYARLPVAELTGRPRDYPEAVYLAFELVKGVFGSARPDRAQPRRPGELEAIRTGADARPAR